MGYNVSEHTLDIVLQAVSNPAIQLPPNWNPPPGIITAADTFVGYLLLDAWIGNGDRHHENWGFIETINQPVYLSPTYDHASSLGRELPDSKRADRIRMSTLARTLPDSLRKERTRVHTVEGYTDKARSAFYASPTDKKSLLTMDTFSQTTNRHPKAACIWLEILSGIAPTDVREILHRIPKERMSPVALEFAHQMLNINQSKLLRLQENLL